MNDVKLKRKKSKGAVRMKWKKEVEEILSKQKDNKTNKSCSVIQLGLC